MDWESKRKGPKPEKTWGYVLAMNRPPRSVALGRLGSLGIGQ